MGPTPCVMTSQPSEVSSGEPQFPNCTNSQGKSGSFSRMTSVCQLIISSENAMKLFSPSILQSMAYLPFTFRGNKAAPLLAILPLIGCTLNDTKSLVDSNLGMMLMPSDRNSQGKSGSFSRMTSVCQLIISSENAMKLFSPSILQSMAYLPFTFRGNKAAPLLAILPLIGCTLNDTKSLVDSNLGMMLMP